MAPMFEYTASSGSMESDFFQKDSAARRSPLSSAQLPDEALPYQKKTSQDKHKSTRTARTLCVCFRVCVLFFSVVYKNKEDTDVNSAERRSPRSSAQLPKEALPYRKGRDKTNTNARAQPVRCVHASVRVFCLVSVVYNIKKQTMDVHSAARRSPRSSFSGAVA